MAFRRFAARWCEPLLLALLVPLCTALLTGVATEKQLYSGTVEHALQSEALLRGQWTLQRDPVFHRYDWLAGVQGLHQAWGLGVPLLRLPFELLSRAFGELHFPDRLHFLLLLAATVATLDISLLAIQRKSGAALQRTEALLVRLAIIAAVFFSPVWLRLLRLFRIYEETVAYTALWSILTVALLIQYATRPSVKRLVVLGCVSGFGFIIRPTSLAYLLPLPGITLLIGRARLGLTRTALASVAFLLLPALGLLFNVLRFGNPLDFGYGRLHPTEGGLVMLQQFHNRMQDVPILEAVLELFAALFLSQQQRAWWWPRTLSSTARFRQFDFHLYQPGLALILVLSIALLAVLSLRGLKRGRREEPVLRLLWFLSLYGALSLLVYLLYFLRSLAITSRYMAEPFFFFLLPVLLLALLPSRGFAGRRGGPRRWIYLPLAGYLVLIAMEFPLSSPHVPGVTRAETARFVQIAHKQMNATHGEMPPDEWRCGVRIYSPAVDSHIQDRRSRELCEVRFGIMRWLRESPCLTVHLTPSRSADAPPFPEAVEMIRATRYGRPLRRVGVEQMDGYAQLIFCGERLEQFRTGYQLAAVGFEHERYHIRIMAVETSARGEINGSRGEY